MDRNVPFTRNPTKLMYVLDSDLWKMLSILIQQEDYWDNAKKLNADGSFYKPMSEFAQIFRKKNLQDVRLMLQTLQSEGFIEVLYSKGGKQANYYRICWNKIEAYNDIPIPQLINNPMLKTTKRTTKKSIEDSTALYQQMENDSTILYQQDRDLIVRDCTTTIDNIQNINNNTTIDNTTSTKSLLHDAYKDRLDSLLSDYANESDYILDMYSSIQNDIEYAGEHLSTDEIEQYQSQLQEISSNHEQRGWNIQLNESNVYNVKTPKNCKEFFGTIYRLLSNAELYISSDRWNDIAENTEKWIAHQRNNDIISYDHQHEAIEKKYEWNFLA